MTAPSTLKNAPHNLLWWCLFGSVWVLLVAFIRSKIDLQPTYWLPRKATANNQFTSVGFHLMKVSSFKNRVRPPSTTIKPSVTHCMLSTLPCRVHDHPTWAMDTAMATAEAT